MAADWSSMLGILSCQMLHMDLVSLCLEHADRADSSETLCHQRPQGTGHNEVLNWASWRNNILSAGKNKATRFREKSLACCLAIISQWHHPILLPAQFQAWPLLAELRGSCCSCLCAAGLVTWAHTCKGAWLQARDKPIGCLEGRKFWQAYAAAAGNRNGRGKSWLLLEQRKRAGKAGTWL